MPTFKIVHVFNSNIADRPAGWTDVWYTIQGDMTAAMTAGENIANERIKGLHQDFDLTWLRVTANIPVNPPPAQRRSRNASLKLLTKTGSLGPQADGDIPGTAAHVRIGNTNNTVFRNWMMRGTPDKWWSNDNDKVGAAAVQQFLIGFLAVLKAQAVNMLHKDPNNVNFVPIPVGSAQYFYLSHRNTGRPFVPFRGRK